MSDVHISTLPDFDPPGNLPDFNVNTRKVWSKEFISHWMTGEINADETVTGSGRTPLKQFFNGTVVPFDTTQIPTAVTWTAFPKRVTAAYKTTPLRWQIADSSRIFQDEYLEWSVARNAKTGDIEGAIFTSEGPEYWQVFASYQKNDFVKLMKDLNKDFGAEIQDSDLWLRDYATETDYYNPCNQWNFTTTTGTIAHLIQPNNTLSAEIDITAQATVVRKGPDGKIISDSDQLIKCSLYGNPGRNSDPVIGGTINGLARAGNSISVANPVAIYVHSFDTSNFQLDVANATGDATDDDLVEIKSLVDPAKVFAWQRGDIAKHQGLRLKVMVPAGVQGKHGQQLNVSNLWDKKTAKHVRYAAQFADYVTMSVSAVATQAPVASPVDCVGTQHAAAANFAARSGAVRGKGPAGPKGFGRAAAASWVGEAVE